MNRNILFSIFVIILSVISCKKPAQKSGLPDGIDYTMYVNSSNGVKMRNEPSLTPKVITIVPNDAMVTIKSSQNEKVLIDKVEGHWVSAEYRKFKGWVFSGFLTLQPRMQALKEYRIGGYLIGETPFVLYENSNTDSKILAKSIYNLEILAIQAQITKVDSLPVRWVKVNARTVNDRKLTGWVYSSQLLTAEESQKALDPQLLGVLKQSLGKVMFRVETIKKFENFTVLTVNISEGGSCNGYGESSCITFVLKDSNLIFTDAGSSSMGYLEKIRQGFAYFFIQAGEGEPCGGFSEKKTTVLNLRNLEKWRIEEYQLTQCDKCIQKETHEICLNDNYTSNSSTTYTNNKDIEITKAQMPREIFVQND